MDVAYRDNQDEKKHRRCVISGVKSKSRIIVWQMGITAMVPQFYVTFGLKIFSIEFLGETNVYLKIFLKNLFKTNVKIVYFFLLPCDK